jgi:hypothetical protein
MKNLKFIFLLIVIFSLTNCEKKEKTEASKEIVDLTNKTADAQIIDFVLYKCGCCWGWVIKVGNDTIKTEHLPDLNPSENIVYPINGKITIGSKTTDCSQSPYKRWYDYYEIKDFTLTR